MPANLFTFYFQKSAKPWKRLTSQEQATANNITRGYAINAANAARQRMSEMLSPGHKYKVGASGAAAENITIETPKEVRGEQFVVNVIEGDKTIANSLIRKGMRPGSMPPAGVLRKWAQDKGIGNLMDHFGHKYVSVKARSGKHSQRAYIRRARAGDGNPGFEAGLKALQWAIFMKGSFRRTSDWNTFTPGAAGRGRFDYVKWTIKQRKYFDDVVDALWDGATLYAKWLASGAKQADVQLFSGKRLR